MRGILFRFVASAACAIPVRQRDAERGGRERDYHRAGVGCDERTETPGIVKARILSESGLMCTNLK